MSNQMMIFEGNQVEIFELNSSVYFNPYHVGKCLELTNSAVRKAVGNMNDKQAVKLKNSDVKKSNIRKLNNAGELFLTESGVYKLVFRSNKPKAEKFTNWVTDEVLPAIRKEGAYITNKADPKMLRDKVKKLEKLSSINNAARTILPVLEKAGMKPEHQVYMLKQLYGKAGVEIPVERYEEEEKIFDLTTMANKLGVYSLNGNPHSKAMGAIVSKLDLKEEDMVLTSFEKNGHVGTSYQYKENVVDKARKWLMVNSYPTQIEVNRKSYKVLYDTPKVGVRI